MAAQNAGPVGSACTMEALAELLEHCALAAEAVPSVAETVKDGALPTCVRESARPITLLVKQILKM